MKSIFLGALAVLLAAPALAVSDKFQCTFEVVDLASGGSAKSSGEKYMLRMPTPSGPDYSLTVAQSRDRIAVNLPNGELSATVDMYYKHAMKPLPGGGFDARQLTCVGISGSFCPKNPQEEFPPLCGESYLACVESNPYHPVLGWKKTTVGPGNVPALDASNLTPSKAEITYGENGEKAVITFDCKFQGTFN